MSRENQSRLDIYPAGEQADQEPVFLCSIFYHAPDFLDGGFTFEDAEEAVVGHGEHAVFDGLVLDLDGEGAAGDLYLEIAFKPDAQFRSDGRDIYLTLPLAPWEAALGASITAPTPEGPVQLTIPPGSAAGRQLRLKERGIPGTPPGDLYVVLAIALPPADKEEAKEAYRAMAKAFDFNPRTHLEGSAP